MHTHPASFKTVRREIARIIHPRAVHTVKTNHRVNDEETLTGILTYFFIYSAVFVVSTLLISINGKDLITSVTSVIATLSNIGPGLGLVGPMGNFQVFLRSASCLLL